MKMFEMNVISGNIGLINLSDPRCSYPAAAIHARESHTIALHEMSSLTVLGSISFIEDAAVVYSGALPSSEISRYPLEELGDWVSCKGLLDGEYVFTVFIRLCASS